MGRGPALTMADVERIAAIKGMDPVASDHAIAKIVGRAPATVSKLAARFEGVIKEYSDLKNREIIHDIDCVRRGYLARIAEPDVVDKCSGPQAAMVFGVLTDKLMLESGRPTQITLGVHADVDLPDVLGRLKRAIEGRQATTSSSGQDDK